jgi:hypothetical protein
VGVAKKAGRDWTNRDHRDSLSGLKQAEGLIELPLSREGRSY